MNAENIILYVYFSSVCKNVKKYLLILSLIIINYLPKVKVPINSIYFQPNIFIHRYFLFIRPAGCSQSPNDTYLSFEILVYAEYLIIVENNLLIVICTNCRIKFIVPMYYKALHYINFEDC